MNYVIDKYFHAVITTVEDSVIFNNSKMPTKNEMIREIRHMYEGVLEWDAEQLSHVLEYPLTARTRNIKLKKFDVIDSDAFGRRLEYGEGLQVWYTAEIIFKVAFESKHECNKAKLKNSKLFEPLYMYRGQ